ncbi:hypothetical protein RJ55_06681 [Drechmeria coniospora]|nr:hypothetical protein RJ55_06681 [Drechmeria coniospora]
MTDNHPSLAVGPDARRLVEFFSRSVTSFQSSGEPMRILCTLPHANDGQPASRRPGAAATVQRLIVLDSSFNPPTRAHAQMARSAVREAVESGSRTRLMLLLAVNNADKAPKPASFPLRLCMMDAFATTLLQGPDDAGSNVHGGLEIDLAVTTRPYFHDKARAVAATGFYDGEDGEGRPRQVFLAGFDTLVRIFDAKYYASEHDGRAGGRAGGRAASGMQAALGPFFDLASLRITTRPDDSWGGLAQQHAYVRQLGRRLEDAGGRAAWASRVELVDGHADADEAGSGGNTGARAATGISSSQVRALVRLGSGEEELDGLVDGEVRRWIELEGLYREGDGT